MRRKRDVLNGSQAADAAADLLAIAAGVSWSAWVVPFSTRVRMVEVSKWGQELHFNIFLHSKGRTL